MSETTAAQLAMAQHGLCLANEEIGTLRHELEQERALRADVEQANRWARDLCTQMEARAVKAEARAGELERWVDDLHSGMYINCVYCGHRYGPSEDAPEPMRDVLLAHIEKCPGHPLREAKTHIAELEEAKRDYLDEIEAALRALGEIHTAICRDPNQPPPGVVAEMVVRQWEALEAEVERLRGALAYTQDGDRPLPASRDVLGKLVREAWVRWAEKQPDPKPHWLTSWDDLAEPDREVDRQIGETIARWVLVGIAAQTSVALSTPPPADPRPKRVALCGSSRFVDVMAVCAWLIERDEGAIAMGLHLLPRWYCSVDDHIAEAEDVAKKMDTLHLCKIDLADEVFVVNCRDYIGESTRREILHAQANSKPLRWFTHDPVGEQVTKILQDVVNSSSTEPSDPRRASVRCSCGREIILTDRGDPNREEHWVCEGCLKSYALCCCGKSDPRREATEAWRDKPWTDDEKETADLADAVDALREVRNDRQT